MAPRLDDIVVATSTAASDDPIEIYCQSVDIDLFRGSLDDVLDRHVGAAKYKEADHVIRIPGDKPVVDPETVDLVLAHHLRTSADYTANISANHPSDRMCPLGFEVEIAKFSALAIASEQATEPFQREHALPYLYDNPEQFHIERVPMLGAALRGSHYRLTLDSAEDYEVISRVYEEFPSSNELKMTPVLDFLDEHPEVAQINGSVVQRSHRSVAGLEPQP